VSLLVLVAGCGGGSSGKGETDSGSPVTHDSGGGDTGQQDATSPPDSTAPDSTAPDDTSSPPADTGVADSEEADSGAPDTGPADTGSPDSEPADTGPGDTGSPDAADAADTALADTGIVQMMQDVGTDGTSPEAATTYTIGGTISGLGAGETVVLQDNGGSNLSLTSNAAFTFAAPVASGGTYAVTVLTQPTSPSQNCVVTMGTGTVGSADVSNVVVTCTAAEYKIGGTLVGLAANNSVTLLDNGGNSLALTANGAFSFTTSVASGSMYAVTVGTQPTTPVQTCTVSAGTGTVGTSNVGSVLVNCETMTYTVGGVLSGLAPNDTLIIEDNGGGGQFLTANGAFAFATPVASGATYSVTITGQPSTPVTEACTISNGSGTVGGANVTTVAINCIPLTSCLGVLQARPSSTNGTYAISINGTPYNVYCDMTDGGWTQVLDQDLTVSPSYQTIAAWLAGVNTSQPNSGQYSILNEIPYLKSGANYQFWINWPVAPQAGSVQWTQVENPLTASQTPTISNVTEIPASQTGCGTFRGLATAIGGQPVALHGDSSYGGCWWWAVGQSGTWGNGIPSYYGPNFVDGTTHAQLWEK